MGKGDQKTRRGKIVRGSFGVRRRKKNKISVQAVVSIPKPKVIEEKSKATKPAPKKAAAEKPAEEKKPAVKKTAAKTTTAKKPAASKKKETREKE